MILIVQFIFIFFVKQNTAYEMRISDWSSDVCSSDLARGARLVDRAFRQAPCNGFSQRAGSVEEVPLRDGALDADREGDHRERDDDPHREVGKASCRERVCK